jgi:hypothetical protein
MAKNYYALLGIPRDATTEQIKSAYRRQAKRLHPDAQVGRDADADPGADEQCFRDVQEAYEMLIDPEQRRAYDRQFARSSRSPAVPLWRRVESLRPRRTPSRSVEPLAPEPLTSREPWFSREQRFSRTSPFSPEPLIPPEPLHSRERLFPLARPQETFWESEETGGPDAIEQLYVEVPLTSRQAERGGRVDIWVPLQVVCSACTGWGGWGDELCPYCAGKGSVADERPLTLSFPGGIVDGRVTRLSLEQAEMPGVVLTVRFVVDGL